METKTRITLGPIFTAGQPAQTSNGQVSPLSLAIEWSNSNQATRLSLFRRLLPHAPDRMRLEHILVRCRDLPCDVECLDYQAVNTPEGDFLPLDALLLALYRSCAISRSIFQLLNELAAVVPLLSTVTNPLSTKGMLATAVEARGFRLNAVFRESGVILVQIGWEPECRSMRFHVCTATFQSKPGGKLDESTWIAQQDVGASQILSDELHRLAPGKPSELLSEEGFQFLQGKSLPAPHEATSQS
jgi:hypothetical protein